MNIERELCEQATGIKQMKSMGKFYDDRGNELTLKDARRIFREGRVVEVPNAGAGSYREVLRKLGYKKVSVEDWTSSAGDWTFRIRGKFVYQENRYPYHGFRYGLAV